MTLVGYIIMCSRQTWQVSQTKHLPASRPDWEREVWRRDGLKMGARTWLLHVCSLFQLDTSQQLRPSLSAEPQRHREMAQGVKLKSKLSRVGFCFMANYRWLLALIPSPSSPSLPLPSITPLLALSCLSLVEKGITNDRRRLPNLSSGKTFQS